MTANLLRSCSTLIVSAGDRECDYNQKKRDELKPTYERALALTNRYAQFRPHCVDLSPGTFASTRSKPTGHPDQHGRFYAQNAEHRSRHSRADRGVRRSSLKAYSGPTRSNGSGAVRLSTAVQPPRFQHAGKLSVALALIGSGIFWTTASTGKDVVDPAPVIVQASITPPNFFFDDAADALAEQMSDAHPITTKRLGNDSQPSPLSHTLTSKPEHQSITTGTDSTPTDQDSIDNPVYESETTLALANTETLPALIEHPSLAAVRKKALSPQGASNTTVAVAAGDTLSGILNDHGVKIDQMPQLLTDNIVKEHLSRLDVGQKLEISQLPNGDFHSLKARVGDDRRITIRRSDNDFAIASIDLPVEKERVVTSGTIEQSLYLAAEQANLKQSTIMELADIFQWELDFARDIRKGDQFSLVYDRLYRDGSYIGDGDILAAEFVRGGKSYRAIRFTTDDGVTGYYAPDGQSKRRTFMRHPVDVVRITSKFNPNRLHPVLHQIRAHRGVDYGSPYGSPIYATADGKVKFAGTKNAYGNTVILQHGKKFSTLYAHMSKISSKSKVGGRVKQGDVIGYVGNSGRVTGTHLHYEFRVNNKQIDPLKVELPAAQPIDSKYLQELKNTADEMSAQMRSVLQSDTTNQLTAFNTVADDLAKPDSSRSE